MKLLTEELKQGGLILLLISICMLTGLSGCASYCANQDPGDTSMFSTSPARGCKVYSPSPDPLSDVPFKQRAEKQTEEGLSVTAVVLSDDESERVFGVDLAANGIQPVWLEIENTTDRPVTLIYVATDPGYYSPNEAAYTNYGYAGPVNDEMNEYFNKHSIGREIPAGGVLSGFFYTNWDPGVKYLNVSIYGEDQEESFVFYFVIPGIKLDYQRVDWDTLYKKDEYVNYESEEELREALEAVPCCATRKDGSGENDALNFFVIGDTDNIISAFMRRGWDVTEPISASSGWRAVKAYFSGARYRTSPMSTVFVFKRGQDIGLQKARSTIHERNHLRLWLMPVRYKGMDVWIGSVSRDVGSYFTFRTPWLSAHAIDPDLDEARTYLVQDLLFSGGVGKFGYIKGIEPATPENPHRNFMKQPWWTDGYRAVFLFGDEQVTLNELTFFDWEWAGEDGPQVLEFIKSMGAKKKTENPAPPADTKPD